MASSEAGVAVDRLSPAPALGPPALTLTEINAALLQASRVWEGGVITFSFPGETAAWPGYEPASEPFVGFAPLSAGQQSAFRAAIAAWDRLITPSFLEVGDAGGPGMIRVGFSGHDELDNLAGHAYGPPQTGFAASPWHGDLWLNAETRSDTFASGTDEYDTLLHELGHALGLKHPFEAPGAVPEPYDSERFSILSYSLPLDGFAVSITESSDRITGRYTPVFPTTPMVFDVAAVQARYGADPTTATGADRYSFSTAQPFFMTIYDAGGVDTIDLSTIARGSDLNLAPGAYSSIGIYSVAAQIAALTAQFPWAEAFIRGLFNDMATRTDGHQAYTWSNNLGIAFSTTIENATGGIGADTLTGNDASNGLLGGEGNDYVRGLNGDDWIDGNGGDDDVNGNMGADVVHGGLGDDLVRGGQGPDTVHGDAGHDPHVNGNLGDDQVHGGDGNDTVFGGQGADSLFGDGGDDWLSGDLGDDVLTGGAGADRFLFRAGGGMDWVSDFSSAAGDRIQLSPGVAFTVADQQGQAVIDLGGGARIGLVGVSTATLGDWLVFV